MATEHKETMSYHQHSSWKTPFVWLFLNEESDFFHIQCKKRNNFAPEQAFYKLFKPENLDYTTTDLFSPLADVQMWFTFEDNQYDVIFVITF
jgi:hypothetical protein